MVQGKLKGVLKCFNDVVDPMAIIKKYSMPKKLSIAIASRSSSCACSNDSATLRYIKAKLKYIAI